MPVRYLLAQLLPGGQFLDIHFNTLIKANVHSFYKCLGAQDV